MGRPRKQETIGKKVMDAEARVTRLRKEYDEALVRRQIVLSGRRPKVAKYFGKCSLSMVH